MATYSKPLGYECEFVDQVPEEYFCKQCKHVAREPQIASCCIEVFCKACLQAVIHDKKPCPSCQKNDISFFFHNKFHPKILALKVYCSLNNRGCEWTGQLQHLDAHLDLTTGDCVYVDVDCPSECNQKVQKHNVDTHLANHCPNRDYTCPHCSFKATFREVSEHFEVCRYYPLVCPNRCGASFERDVLEDHLKICGLQKVQCEFSHAGCGAEFIRDHQKEHMEQNTQKHLALVAAATLRISQEKDAQIKKLETKVHEQQKQLQKQTTQLNLKDQQIEKLRRDLKNTKTQLLPLTNQLKSSLEAYRFNPPFDITIDPKVDSSYSLPMCTHQGGYVFRLIVWLKGWKSSYDTHVSVAVYPNRSDHDDTLKFPARFTITLELLNQHRDQDHHRRDIQCEVTNEKIENSTAAGADCKYFPRDRLEWNEHNQTQYLKENCLKFKITKIVVL